MARRCLDAVLVDCNASPRDNFRPVIHWTSPGGADLAFPTGLTEKAFVRKLEDIIVRLAIDDNKPSRSTAPPRRRPSSSNRPLEYRCDL